MKLPADIPVYGDTSFRGACPSEALEMVTFFARIRKTPLGAIATHIRNEGQQQRGRFKAEGMVKGASDIIIPGAPTFVCELKRQDHTKCRLAKEQVEYLLACQKAGAFACVALGADGAIKAVDSWLLACNDSRHGGTKL